MDIGEIQFAPQYPRGFRRGHQFKSLGKLSNNWTDWHQSWYTSADSSGNGHRLNTIRPSISQGGHFVGFRGHKFKSMLKLSNGWTDWHQSWHTCADSSGNGYTSNKLPFIDTRGHLGGFRGSNIQQSGEAVKLMDRLAPTLVHVCGFIWDRT